MSDGHALAMALRAAYLAMHRRADAHFTRRGITADQFVLLAALADGDAVTQRELARRTSSDPNTVRAMLVLLEGRGLVARDRHPTDGRARTAALTPKGRRTVDRLWVGSESLRHRLTSNLRPVEEAELLGLLDRITRAMVLPAAHHRTHQ